MTAGEFAKKYGIDYQTVRSATFRTATRAETSWALDYPETELRAAVEQELQYRLIWHWDRLTRTARALKRLGKAGA